MLKGGTKDARQGGSSQLLRKVHESFLTRGIEFVFNLARRVLDMEDELGQLGIGYNRCEGTLQKMNTNWGNEFLEVKWYRMKNYLDEDK